MCMWAQIFTEMHSIKNGKQSFYLLTYNKACVFSWLSTNIVNVSHRLSTTFLEILKNWDSVKVSFHLPNPKWLLYSMAVFHFFFFFYTCRKTKTLGAQFSFFIRKKKKKNLVMKFENMKIWFSILKG